MSDILGKLYLNIGLSGRQHNWTKAPCRQLCGVSLFFTALLFSGVLSSIAQYNQDSIFCKDSLIKDLYDLKSAIIASHPNPYGFCSREEFNGAYSHAVSYLTENRSLGEFCKTVGTVMQVMKDSHSCIDFEYLQNMQLRNGKYILPLQFISLSGGIYLMKDRDGLIDPGSRIICINNVEIEKIYVEAMRFACVEGRAVSAQQRVADAVLPVVLGMNIDLGPEIKIDIEKEDEIREIVYPAYNQRRWKERQKKLEDKEFGEAMSLSVDEEDNTAVLKIGTFAPLGGLKYANFIRKSFKEIKKKNIENVVLDIRGNGGGSSSWVEYLYSFIDTAGYNTPDNIIGKNSELAMKRSSGMLRPISQWMIRNFYKKNEDVQNYIKILKMEKGEMDTLYFSDPVVQKIKKVYTGNCYLLINGLTASAAVDFTHSFREKKRGVIIGEPCLGPVTGTWGNPASFSLPRSGVKVNIATIRYNYDRSFRYDPQPIKPDYDVKTEITDLEDGKDTQIEFAKRLIQKKSISQKK
ncbi:MAG: hypothetical protein IT223_08245 [Crocinitomicaceae bacterium]|nr:hypothetical protein [Crocinitomicaceae bacterium]